MSRDRRRDDGWPNAGSSAAGPLATPGKRTLTESLSIQHVAGANTDGLTPSSGGSGGLPDPLRERMESAFDFDFGGVRVHEGGERQRWAQSHIRRAPTFTFRRARTIRRARAARSCSATSSRM